LKGQPKKEQITCVSTQKNNVKHKKSQTILFFHL